MAPEGATTRQERYYCVPVVPEAVLLPDAALMTTAATTTPITIVDTATPPNAAVLAFWAPTGVDVCAQSDWDDSASVVANAVIKLRKFTGGSSNSAEMKLCVANLTHQVAKDKKKTHSRLTVADLQSGPDRCAHVGTCLNSLVCAPISYSK